MHDDIMKKKDAECADSQGYEKGRNWSLNMLNRDWIAGFILYMF